jgi:hypothetical protein
MTAIQYVDFNKEVAKEMWDHVSVNLDCFQAIKALREGIAIVGIVDIDAAYELTDTCAVNIVVLACELQVDPENEQFNLQAGLNISPELRAILTIKISRMLEKELSAAIRDCADWIEATADAPDGFIGEKFPLEAGDIHGDCGDNCLDEQAEESDELIEETSEPDPFEDEKKHREWEDQEVQEQEDSINAEVTPSDDDQDNPY